MALPWVERLRVRIRDSFDWIQLAGPDDTLRAYSSWNVEFWNNQLQYAYFANIFYAWDFDTSIPYDLSSFSTSLLPNLIFRSTDATTVSIIDWIWKQYTFSNNHTECLLLQNLISYSKFIPVILGTWYVQNLTQRYIGTQPFQKSYTPSFIKKALIKELIVILAQWTSGVSIHHISEKVKN